MNNVEAAWQECIQKIPGVMLRNRSVTTSSIYAKTPDGYSLRIGDHKGIEKWAYKWNLRLDMSTSVWKTEHKSGKHISRYYTGNIDDLAREIKISLEARQDLRDDLEMARAELNLTLAALKEIEAGCLMPEAIAAMGVKAVYDSRRKLGRGQ